MNELEAKANLEIGFHNWLDIFLGFCLGIWDEWQGDPVHPNLVAYTEWVHSNET